ncbi:SAV_2336 N-terminal domain-related protein [Streptomyces griseosporeus]|uniref:SAV_2336 N-terminal domain-related protein n=1 Tax=Streptomyces griseosporeus TaxID=1910 RepID=UPI003702CB82
MSDALSRLVRALGNSALPAGTDARSLADALWLAASGTVDRGPAPPRAAPATDATGRPDPPRPPEQAPPTPAGDGGATGTRNAELSVRRPGAGSTVRGTPLSLGRAGPLPDALAVGRAVQPFRRPWRRGARGLLDIDATVEHYARGGPLVPLFRPAPEAWFEAVVIVDSALSMSVWDETTRAVTRLLSTLGGFRAVHTWRLEWQGDEPSVRDHLGSEVPRDRVPHHGSGTGGRRLVLLVSDCAAAGWYSPVPWLMLRDWGALLPVALLDPLPPRLWRRSALNLPAVRVTADRAGEPNSALRFRLPPRLRAHDATGPQGTWTALPVVSCGPHSLGAWASTLMRTDPRGCDAVLIPATGRPSTAHNGPAPSRQPDPERLADAFVLTAPAPAVRLAVLCSGLPDLPLSLLHILREEAVPEARYADLAELLTSGLFTVRRDTEGEPLLVLAGPARARLRTHLTTHDVWRVRAAFSRHAAAHPYAPGGVAAVRHDPMAAQLVPAQSEPFAETATAVREERAAAAGRGGATRPVASEAEAVYEAVHAQLRPLYVPPVSDRALPDTGILLRSLIDYTYDRLPAPLGGWPHRDTLFDDLRTRPGGLTPDAVIADLVSWLSEAGIDLEGPPPSMDPPVHEAVWRMSGAQLRVAVRREIDVPWPRVLEAVRTTTPRTPVVLSPVEFLLVVDDSDKPGGLRPLNSCVALVQRRTPLPGAVVVFRLQTRLGGVREQGRGAFVEALRDLYRKAGTPPYSALVRAAAAASPHVRLSGSTLSDWLLGRTLPADGGSFAWLVERLALLAEPESDPGPTVAALADLRHDALRRRRDALAPPTPSARLGQPVTRLDDPAARAGAPPYAERSHDTLLRTVVRDCADGVSRLVLLVGPPGSGKTRSAREAIRTLPHDWFLWAPGSRADLDAALDTPVRIGARTVIWLGDAERHLLDDTPDAGGERVAAALRMRLSSADDGPVLVLGTLRTEAWNTLTSAAPPRSPDRHPQARDLCRTAVAVPVSPQGDSSSLSYLTEGAAEIERYTSAAPPVRRYVDAAIDAVRCGHGPVIPGELLADAAKGYPRNSDEEPGGRGRVTLRALNVAGLLEMGGSDGQVPAGYFRLAEHIEQYGREIRRHTVPPASLWDALARHATAADLEAIARAAESQGESRQAERFRGLVRERRQASAVQETDHHRLVGQLARTDLDADGVRSVVDAAMAWLGAYGSTDDAAYVLTALLRRPYLSGQQAPPVCALTLQWLEAHEEAQDTGVVLTVLLASSHLTAADADQVMVYLGRWLAAHGSDGLAWRVLTTALAREDWSPRHVRVLAARTLDWLGSQGLAADIRFVYGSALGRSDLPPDALRRFVAYGLDRLRSDESEEAAFTFASLLQRGDLAAEEARDVTQMALTWLERHGQGPYAQFVLGGLLSRSDLTPDDLGRVYVRASLWLDEHGTEPFAELVLRPLLLRTDLEWEATARAVEAGRRWCDARSADDEPDNGIGDLVRIRAAALDTERDHLVLAVDIAGLAHRSEIDQAVARDVMDRVMLQASPYDGSLTFYDGIDRSDGRIMAFAAGTEVATTARELLVRLERAVRGLHEDGSVRLRLALHFAKVPRRPGAWRGQEMLTPVRLVDSAPLRAALEAASGAPAALAVSDTLFRTAFSADESVAGRFGPVNVPTKNGVEKAWISVIGYERPPGLEAWSRPPDHL